MNTENHYQETDLGNIAPNPRGEYNPKESYEYLDLVVFEGGSYICLTDTTITDISPESGKTTKYWQVITIPGDLTPGYIAMHDRVVNLSEQVEADAEEVRAAQQNVSGMELNVTQMQEQTRQAAESAESSKDSAAGHAASADASRRAAAESEQNINTQVTGFDDHAAEKTTESIQSVENTRIAANKAIIAQQEQSVNEVTRAGIEAISTAQAAAQTATEKAQAAATSEKNAAASETAAKLSEENATKMAEQVATDKEQVAYDRTAVENAKQEMTGSVAQIEQNTQGIAELKGDIDSELKIKKECGINAINTNDLIGKKVSEVFNDGNSTIDIPIDWNVIPIDYIPISVICILDGKSSQKIYFAYVGDDVSVSSVCGSNNGLYERGKTKSVRLSTNGTYFPTIKDSIITGLQWVSGENKDEIQHKYVLSIVSSSITTIQQDVSANSKKIELLEAQSDAKYFCGINALNTNNLIGKKYGELFKIGNSVVDIPIDWSAIPEYYNPTYVVASLDGELTNQMYFGYVTDGVASLNSQTSRQPNGMYTRGKTQFLRLSTNDVYLQNLKDKTITALYWTNGKYVNDPINKDYVKHIEFPWEAKKIMCWGDSRTAQEWHKYLLDNIDDKLWSISHGGVGGQRTIEIASRQGGIPLMVDEFTIPYDTSSVEVELYAWYDGKKSLNLLENSGNRQLNPVTICGVEGEISKVDGKYFFARTADGDLVKVDDFTNVETYGSKVFDNTYVTIIFSGANDKMTESDIPDWIAIQKSMIEKLGEHARYIIVGEYFSTDYSILPKFSSAQARAFGKHFCDLRNYTLNYGLKKAGIEPTDQDKKNILNGVIPTSLRTDQVHQNDKWKEITSWLVYKQGKELGYW